MKNPFTRKQDPREPVNSPFGFDEDEHPWNRRGEESGGHSDEDVYVDEDEDLSQPIAGVGDDLSRYWNEEREWLDRGVPPGGRDSGQQGQPEPEPEPEPSFRPIPTDKGFTVKALTEAAMMIAISVVLALIGSYVPVLNIFGVLLYPLPIAALCLRRGMKVGIAASVALLALSAILLGFLQALLLLVEMGVLGLYLGYCFRRGKQPLTTLVVATLIAAAGIAFGLLLSIFVSGLPVSALSEQMGELVEESINMFLEAGGEDLLLARDPNLDMDSYLEEMSNALRQVVPGVIIVSGMLMTALTYIISVKILRRLRYDIPSLPRFVLWRMDWRLAWGIILALALQFAGRFTGLQWISALGGNLLYVICPILIITGLSFFIWYIKNIVSQLWIKILIVMLALQFLGTTGLTLYVIMFLAVLDGIYDLRPAAQRRKERRERMKGN